MRTTMNYQYRYGTTTTEAMRHLWKGYLDISNLKSPKKPKIRTTSALRLPKVTILPWQVLAGSDKRFWRKEPARLDRNMTESYLQL